MTETAARGPANARNGPQPSTGGRKTDQRATDTPPGVRAAWPRAAQASLVGIFVILLFIALEEARAILIPVTAAFVIGTMLGPVAKRANDLQVPPVVTAIALWLLVVAVFYALVTMLSGPALDLISRAPDIGRTIEGKLNAFERALARWPSLSHVIIPTTNSGPGITNLMQSTVAIVTPAVGALIVFFATLFFFLLARSQLRTGLIAYFKNRDARRRAIRIMNEVEQHLTGYLGIVTLINTFVGVAAGLIALFVGLPNPLAWGIVAFILNYIPYLGALMIELAFLAFGIVQFSSLGQALLAPLLYLAVATFEGQFLTPAVLGRRLPLNSLTVFLSVVFWTWLWGPAGTFLATPLAITAFAIVENVFDNDEPELPG